MDFISSIQEFEVSLYQEGTFFEEFVERRKEVEETYKK